MLVVDALRPLSAGGAQYGSESNNAAPVQVKLGTLEAVSSAEARSSNTSTPTYTPTTTTSTYNGQKAEKAKSGAVSMLAAGDETPPVPPTPLGLANVTPLVPNSTPTIYVTDVEGRFFYNGSGSHIFNIGTQTPPAFVQHFPLINFNPSASYNCNGTVVGSNTRPLTDADESNPCALIPAQVTTPVLLQAGVGTLTAYQAVLSTTLYVSQAADITFNIYSDDGFIWGIGPLNGIAGNPQPIRLSGTYDPPPPPSPTPYPTTTFRNYTVVGQYNNGSWGGGQVTVRFPVAGFYPIEMDNAEDGVGGLSITLDSPANTPVLNGPTPTATSTPSVICDASSYWCTGLSPNSGAEHNELHSVAVIAQNNIWAVGGQNITAQGGHSLVEHWTGSQWTVVTGVPDIGTLNGVVDASTNGTNIYAVGVTGILQLNLLHWTQVRNIGGNGIASHDTDVWAVGCVGSR